MAQKSYKTPAAYKRALEDRMKRKAREEETPLNRLRQLLIFERFLARVYACWGKAVLLKGGLALELRLERARTTKDIDLRIVGDFAAMLEELQDYARKNQDDFFTFTIVSSKKSPQMHGEQTIYEGQRLDVEAFLGGMSYGSRFHLDISVADKLVLPPERLEGTTFFDFIAVEPLVHRVYPMEAHLAEKLHALTIPREQENSRLKDLIDIGLLANHDVIDAKRLFHSVEATFTFRNTHKLPTELPSTPQFWSDLYPRLRDENDLRWPTLDELAQNCSEFFDPLLQTPYSLDHWDPKRAGWIKSAKE